MKGREGAPARPAGKESGRRSTRAPAASGRSMNSRPGRLLYLLALTLPLVSLGTSSIICTAPRVKGTGLARCRQRQAAPDSSFRGDGGDGAPFGAP